MTGTTSTRSNDNADLDMGPVTGMTPAVVRLGSGPGLSGTLRYGRQGCEFEQRGSAPRVLRWSPDVTLRVDREDWRTARVILNGVELVIPSDHAKALARAAAKALEPAGDPRVPSASTWLHDRVEATPEERAEALAEAESLVVRLTGPFRDSARDVGEICEKLRDPSRPCSDDQLREIRAALVHLAGRVAATDGEAATAAPADVWAGPAEPAPASPPVQATASNPPPVDPGTSLGTASDRRLPVSAQPEASQPVGQLASRPSSRGVAGTIVAGVAVVVVAGFAASALGWVAALVVVGVGALAGGATRTARVSRLRAEAAAPRDLTTGRVVGAAAGQAAGVVLTGSAAEALMRYHEMLAAGDSYTAAVQAIDSTVVEAVSSASARVAGTSLPSVSADPESFMNWFAEHTDAAINSGTAERLVGYVGEAQAFDALEAQGHFVQAAVTANNATWDALVDGSMVNIKTHSEVYAAAQAAREHPDVTYLLPGDAAGNTDAANVVVWDGFSRGGAEADYYSSMHSAGEALDAHTMANAAQDSLASGDFVVDALNGPIPLTLVAFTAYRQVKLVHDGKRWQHALTDGGIDIVVKGTGLVVGGAAGAKVGALVDAATGGSLLFLPTVVCSVGGAIAGSTVGAVGIDWWKNRHIRAAQRELEDALAVYGWEFCDDDHLERLLDVVQRPTTRARAATDYLREFHHDHRGLRWWLWPGADQVLVEQAVLAGERRTADQQQREESSLVWLSEAVNDPRLLGLTMATAPALAAHVDQRDHPPGSLQQVAQARQSLNEQIESRRVRG